MVNGFQEMFIIVSVPNICGRRDGLPISPRSPRQQLTLQTPRSLSPEKTWLFWETHRRLAHCGEMVPPTHARAHVSHLPTAPDSNGPRRWAAVALKSNVRAGPLLGLFSH